MSLHDWKKEFYPCNAEEFEGTDLEAIEHSLRKWQGLTESNLKKHGLILHGERIEDPDAGMVIDGDSCALCALHAESSIEEGFQCPGCPLDAIGENCDLPTSAYRESLKTGSPKKMISALRKARLFLEAKNENEIQQSAAAVRN